MTRRHATLTLAVLALTTAARAQTSDDDRRCIQADSIKADYEEWLRHEPLRPAPDDSLTVRPFPPATAIIDPRELQPSRPPVSVVIMSPRMRTDMQLAYQSHQLEEQRRSQQGGAMLIGANPLTLIGFIASKLFPHRKSKKQREREKLQRVLDNY